MKISAINVLAVILVISGAVKVLTGDMSYYGVKSSGGEVRLFGSVCLVIGVLLLHAGLKKK